MSPVDNQLDQVMEEMDENEEEMEVDAAADEHVDGRLNAENEDMNDEVDDELGDADDPFTDGPSQQPVSRARLPGHAIASIHSPAEESASASSQASGFVDGPPRSHPAPPQEQAKPSQASQPTATVQPGMSSVVEPYRPSVPPEALTATSYDIVPTIAAPHATSINAIAATPNLRWVFTGGADGYIRKYGWVESVNGRVMLTVAQRHPFVDSVTKAGVLLSYWENEDVQPRTPVLQPDDNLSLSPVYSLAVHSQALWLLSGLDSGGINLQSVRHDEGKLITCLRKHTSAVSVLTLAEDERSVISGSWDKAIYDWDLNTGLVSREFRGSGGQISTIEFRPLSTLPVPAISDPPKASETFSSNNADQARTNGFSANVNGAEGGSGSKVDPGSPADSLFGDNTADSLFGDYDEKPGPSELEANQYGGGDDDDDDDDDEFSRAIANGFQEQDDELAAAHLMAADAALAQPPEATTDDIPAPPSQQQLDNVPDVAPRANNDAEILLRSSPNGLPHSSEPDPAPVPPPFNTTTSQQPNANEPTSPPPPSSNSTFLAASMDGTLRVWDRRQPAPVASILPRNCPPWCMNACWSPDGNYIYAGRRNGTVEEYSLHAGLREPERVFRFPQGSGPVSALKAMPNGRHLICASFDILRLYDLGEQQQQQHHQQQQQHTSRHSTVPFLIIPGHRGGVVSSLYLDPTCKYLMSTAGNRGWEGSSTEVLLGYEIGFA